MLAGSCFSIHPQGWVMPFWGLLGFTSDQTVFPRAADPHLSCTKGSSEGTSALPSVFPAGILGPELIPNSKGRAALAGQRWSLANNPPLCSRAGGRGEP